MKKSLFQRTKTNREYTDREYLRQLQRRLDLTNEVVQRAALAYVISRQLLDRLDQVTNSATRNDPHGIELMKVAPDDPQSSPNVWATRSW
jgi:hypothetical protein